MKAEKVLMFFLVVIIFASISYSFQTNSTNYRNFPLIVSSGGEISNSSTYKNYVATGLIAGVINSSTYKNFLGFFYGWLLANGQACTANNQCEGGFCCSNVCRSSTCPVEEEEEEEEAGPAPAPGGGGGGGGGYRAPNITRPPVVEVRKNFIVFPSNIKVTLVQDKAIEKILAIKNTGDASLEFVLDIIGIKDYLFLSDNSFELRPNEEKAITLNFIGKDVGSFTGHILVKGDGIEKAVPIIFEVMSEIILFDVKLDVPNPEVFPGDYLETQVTIINVGAPEKVDALVTYLIKDLNGVIIYEETETFAVETQISFPKSFKIDENTKPGDYVIIAEVLYANSFAVSSQFFKVLELKPLEEIQLIAKNITKILYFLIVLILIVLLFIYIYVRKKFLKNRNFIRCYKLMVKANNALGKDKQKARELYMKSREIYAKLDNIEKKELYVELMDLHKKLKNKRS